MKRSRLRIPMMVLAGVFCFVLLLGPGLLSAPITLLLGWWPAAARLIHRWQASSAAVVLFTVAASLLLAGTHRFLSWVYAARTAKENAGPATWRWKWTLGGFGVIACTLLAICALVLTTHQIYWLSKSSDPLFVDPVRERVRVLRLAADLQKRAEELKWDTAKTREFFQTDGYAGSGQSAAEAVQPVWIENDAQSLRAIILIPRHPLSRRTARLTVLRPGTSSATHRLPELPEVMASFHAGGSPRRSDGDVTPPQ